MTTTREAALEAALRLARNRLQACAIDYPTGSREMAERSEWADEATAALSTPATEPQRYVDELIERLRAGVVQCGLHEDNNTELFDIEDANEAMFEAAQALAARPAPQPAADTPAMRDELATMISDLSHTGELSMLYRMEIADRITALRAIIGTATPAPSDKTAEAAPDFVADVMQKLRRFQEVTEDVEGTGVDIGRKWLDVLTFLGLLERVQKSPALWQITDAALRALAGKGE